MTTVFFNDDDPEVVEDGRVMKKHRRSRHEDADADADAGGNNETASTIDTAAAAAAAVVVLCPLCRRGNLSRCASSSGTARCQYFPSCPFFVDTVSSGITFTSLLEKMRALEVEHSQCQQHQQQSRTKEAGGYEAAAANLANASSSPNHCIFEARRFPTSFPTMDLEMFRTDAREEQQQEATTEDDQQSSSSNGALLSTIAAERVGQQHSRGTTDGFEGRGSAVPFVQCDAMKYFIWLSCSGCGEEYIVL